jgi:hypothetical protein
MEQHDLNNANSCWNTKISIYLETSGSNAIKRFTVVSYERLLPTSLSNLVLSLLVKQKRTPLKNLSDSLF